MYYDMKVDGTVVYGGCAAWQRFVGGDLSIMSVTRRPVSVIILVVTSLDTNVYVPESVSCMNYVEELIGTLTDFTSMSLNVSCDNGAPSSVWSAAETCSQASLCYDCNVSSLSCEVQCDQLNIVSPCAVDNCDAESGASFIRIVTVQFESYAAAPGLNISSAVASVDTITMNVTSAGNGTAYCAAFITGVSEPQITNDIMIFNNQVLVSEGGSFTITIAGVVAATEYDMYCLTVSKDNVIMPLSTSMKNKLSVTTECCKIVHVSLLSTSMYITQSKTSVVQISVDAPPSSLLLLDITATSALESFSPFFPDSWSVSNLSVASTSVAWVANIVDSTGSYDINVALSGASAAEYSVQYDYGTALIAIDTNTEPPLPIFISATFSADGTSVALHFDSATDRANVVSQQFDCTSLLTFVGANYSTCIWNDNTDILIYPGGDSTDISQLSAILDVGSSIILKPNLVKALCNVNGSADASSCISWASIEETSVTVFASANSVVPLVAISTPSIISSCVDLTLDISGSVGNCGREWLSYSISVDSVATNVSHVQEFMTTDYEVSPPTPIPYGILESGYTYYFTVVACNFLGLCGRGQQSVSVVSTRLPTVILLGQQQRVISRRSALQLSSNAFISECGGTVSYRNLVYSWVVLFNNVVQIDINSISSKDVTLFKLAAYSLEVNKQYEIRLTVTNLANLKSSFSSAFVYVEAAELVTIVAGGSAQSVQQSGSPLVLDASQSYDQDSSPLETTTSSFSFSWSCVQILPVYSLDCAADLLLPNATDQPSLAVAALSSSAADAEYVFTVTLSDATRVAQASVTVTIIPADAPLVSVTTVFPSKINVNSLFHLNGVVTLAATGTAVWSVDSLDVDLEADALTAVSVLITTDSTAVSPQYLSLGANALPTRSTLTFTLSCTLLSGQFTSVQSLWSLMVLHYRDIFLCRRLPESRSLIFLHLQHLSGQMMTFQLRTSLVFWPQEIFLSYNQGLNLHSAVPRCPLA